MKPSTLLCVGALAVLCAQAAAEMPPGGPAYLEAHRQEHTQRYASARETYLTCARHDGLLRPYAEVRAAVCQAHSGDLPGGYAALEAAIMRNGEGPWVRLAQTELAMLLYEAKDYARAGLAFQAALASPIAPGWLREYSWRAADALTLHLPTAAQGFQTYAALLENSRSWRRRTEAALALTRSINLEHLLLATEALLDMREYREAERVLNRLQALPVMGPKGAARLRYLWGRCLVQTDRIAEGAALLEAVAAESAEPGLAQKARAAYVQMVIKERGTAEALAALDDFVAAYPSAIEGGDVLLAWAAKLRKENPSEAAAAYERVASLYPKHESAPGALWRAAWIHLDRGNRAEARRVFVRFASQYPLDSDAPEAWYRAGSLALGAGHEEAGWTALRRAAQGPLGRFYVHRALEHLAQADKDEGLAGPSLARGGLPSVVRPRKGRESAPETIPAEWEDQPAIRRLLFFGEHGLEEAEWEALHLARLLAAGERAEPLMRAFAEAGVAASAMEYAQLLEWEQPGGEPGPAALRVRFPLAYWEKVREAARQTGLDPLLILAVARQESRFKARAVSSAGATGIMQLMPRTAQWLADTEPTLSQSMAAHLTHPEHSLRMGATYLAKTLKRYDGHLVYAAGAYNAGPGNMNKWRRRLPTGDPGRFIDAIPYRETQGFIKHVLGNYAAYRSLYQLR